MFKFFFKRDEDSDPTEFYFHVNFDVDVVISAVIVELIKQFLNI